MPINPLIWSGTCYSLISLHHGMKFKMPIFKFHVLTGTIFKDVNII